VNERNLTRALAIVCILAAFPIAFLTLPWLPGTILEFVELLRAPVPTWATESFRTSREAHLHRLEVALTLYALGLLVLGGFVAITAKILPIWGELLLWLMAAATAVRISTFWGPSISPSINPTFIFMAVRLPLLIAAVAGLGAVVNLAGIGVRFYRNPGQ
jgi:hypothetical protein